VILHAYTKVVLARVVLFENWNMKSVKTKGLFISAYRLYNMDCS
jgi:hypothetical protein